MTHEHITRGMQQVYDRAASDAAFRQLCLTDAHEAFRTETGMELPEDFRVRFVDGTGADATIVLPEPPRVDGQLSDAELLAVVGGSLSDWLYGCDRTCCASAGSAKRVGNETCAVSLVRPSPSVS
jgi:hypothetical protein